MDSLGMLVKSFVVSDCALWNIHQYFVDLQRGFVAACCYLSDPRLDSCPSSAKICEVLSSLHIIIAHMIVYLRLSNENVVAS